MTTRLRILRKQSLGLFALLAVATDAPSQAAPAGITSEDKADVVCVLLFATILGSSENQNFSAEQKQGLMSVATYFVGKLKGRRPALEITDILAPDYVLSLLAEIEPAKPRCSQEAIKVGADLQQVGDILIGLGKQAAPTS